MKHPLIFSISKWANESNRQLMKELQIANKYLKKHSTSLAIMTYKLEAL